MSDMNLNFDQVKKGFQDYLDKFGKNYDKTNQKEDSDSSSIFMNSEAFQDYLTSELGINDASGTAVNINDMKNMEIVDGQLQRKGLPENPDKNYANADLFANMMNDLLKDEDFISTLDSSKDGNIDMDEMLSYFENMSGFDENEENISLSDLIASTNEIQDKVNKQANKNGERQSVADKLREQAGSGVEAEYANEGKEYSNAPKQDGAKTASGSEGASGASESALGGQEALDSAQESAMLGGEMTGAAADALGAQEGNLSSLKVEMPNSKIADVSNIDNMTTKELDKMSGEIASTISSQKSDLESVTNDTGALANAKATVDNLKKAYDTALQNSQNQEIAVKIQETMVNITTKEGKITDVDKNINKAVATKAQEEENLARIKASQSENEANLNENQKAYKEQDGIKTQAEARATALTNEKNSIKDVSEPSPTYDEDGNCTNQAQIDAAKKTNAENERKREELDKQIEEAKKQGDDAQAKMDELKLTEEEIKAEGMQLSDEEKTAQEAVGKAQAEIDKLEADKEILRQDLATLNEQKSNYEEQLDKQDEALQEAKDNYNNAKLSYDAQKNTIMNTLRNSINENAKAKGKVDGTLDKRKEEEQ